MEAELIEETANQVGLAISRDVVQRLSAFARLFLRWNERINLGGDLSVRELVERHFLDAFAAARALGPHGTGVDVGTGGGLPVLPLALTMLDWRFDLYEPTAKKVAFLRTAVRETGLGERVTVHAKRMDSSERANVSESFDVALSRATFAPAEWLPIGLGLVRSGGRVLVFGTADVSPGCPPPDQAVSYARNRSLFVYLRRGESAARSPVGDAG